VKVKTLNLAGVSYALIQDETRELTVLMRPALPVAASLLESACEMRESAERLLSRAEFIERALREVLL
jgi:hypothetical protein